MVKIGVFDSGLGGISVLHQLHEDMPQAQLIYFGDSAHNPYGTKTKEEITERCVAICDWFVGQDVDAIVIACNTATSAAAPLLRQRYDLPIIGMEPALKPAAALPGVKKVAVWATELTLKEKKFHDLMVRFEDEVQIVRVACPLLVTHVEAEDLDIDDILQEYMAQSEGADAVVLGCTHFVFFKKRLQTLFPHVRFVDGNAGTSHHVLDLVGPGTDEAGARGKISWNNSDPDKIGLSRRLYEKLKEDIA